MSSWRDDASQQAQDDLDGLLDATLPFAQQMLDKNGEFFPFGASVSTNGDVAIASADPAVVGEHPASTDVLAALADGFRAGRDHLRAVALVSDVRLADSDAVRVELEHSDGHSLAVLLPYQKKRFGRGIQYGDLAAAGSETQVWHGG